MALDLRILLVDPKTRSLVPAIWPAPDYADGTYSLVQRIVKCLATAPGENEQDPEYGANLRGEVRHLAGQQLEEARTAVGAALRKCVDDLSVDPSTDPEQRLRDLRLASLTYSLHAQEWQAAVEVETDANVFTIPLEV